MTSRQRKRKVGLMRIDAALDALCPMGFSRDLVRKTVNMLLKAYGGDQGWAFIEEASYKVVIDAILDGQESQEKAELENTQPKLLDCSPLKVESVIQSHSPCAQSLQDDSRCINHSLLSDVTGHSYTSQEKVTAEVHFQAQHMHSMNNSHCPLQDTLEHKVTIENCRAVTGADVESPGVRVRPAMGSDSIIKKRKPCYGWISNDDNVEEDLVFLLPSRFSL